MTLTFANSWVVESGDAKVYRNGNTIKVEASLASGTTTSNTTICTLPVNFRPSVIKIKLISSCGTDYLFSVNSVRIGTDGAVIINELAKNTRLLLDFSFGI